jgi:hypothetical protein
VRSTLPPRPASTFTFPPLWAKVTPARRGTRRTKAGQAGGKGRISESRAARIIRPMQRVLAAFIVVLLTAFPGGTAAAQAAPGATPAPAARVPLDGRWDLLVDRDNVGLKRGLQDPAAPGWGTALKVLVPGPFEAHPQAADHDGVAWYRLELPATPTPPAGRLWLHFDEASYRVDGWLEGEALGRHDGPGPFRWDLSGKLDHARRLVLRVVDAGEKRVDDLLLGGLPCGRESWGCNPGGLLGSVALVPAGAVEVLRHDARLLPDGSAQLRVDLQLNDTTGRAVTLRAEAAGVAGELQSVLAPGANSLLLPLPGAEALPRWSPASPVRHPLALAVRDAAGAELARAEGLLGLRRFAAAGPRFELDGQPLRPRGVTLPPTFPRTLSSPPDPDWLRRELTAIREAGFDLVRVEQRLAPEAYALCDELGLLVSAEPPLGRITHELPLTAAAVDAALVAFADAVQGHPSVVMVSLLDEGGGLLWRRHDELLARAHELLPERLLLSDGGGHAGAARLHNPHEPDAVPCADVRLPARWPLTPAESAMLDALGRDGRLTWVSRWSAGGLPSFMDNVGGFANQLSGADAAAHVKALQDATAALAGTPLGQLAGDLPQLDATARMAQALAARGLGSLLRSHPGLAGECYAAWRESGWRDSDALCDAWGRPKPALAALRRSGEPGSPLPAAPPPVPERARRPFSAGSLVDLTPGLLAVAGQLVVRPGSTAGLPRLAVLGGRPISWAPDAQPVSVALLRFVRDGGTLLLLAPPQAPRFLATDLTAPTGHGQLADLPVDVAARPVHEPDVAGLLLFAERSLLLSDLPVEGRVLDARLAAVRPEHVLTSPPGADVELACVDAAGRYVGAAVQAVPYGQGHLVLSTLPFTDASLAEPAVERLFENLLRFTANVASRKPEPAVVPVEPPPPALRDAIAQHLRRLGMWFGLAERQATAQIPDLRPTPRADPADLKSLVARKNLAMDLIVQGRAAEGAKLVADLEAGPQAGPREAFVRAELAYSEQVALRLAAGPVPQAESRELAAPHARALRLSRLGEGAAALATLEAATSVLRGRSAGHAAHPPSTTGGEAGGGSEPEQPDGDGAGAGGG